MQTFSHPTSQLRLGFHYFPDTRHYRETDLHTWLPELRSLGAGWLVLDAPAQAAIPESFIKPLLAAGIQPILHFGQPVTRGLSLTDLRVLLAAYARWGVRYITLFDQPNMCSAWGVSAWSQNSLVERFTDAYLPLAEATLQAGLVPVFPPLRPGGDYWDTAFLRRALQSIQRRGQSRLLENLVLGAYACYGDRSLDWGAGGPERWPDARPYSTPSTAQDQRGFHIYDWYQAIFRAVVGRSSDMLLFKVGQGVEPVVARPAGSVPHSLSLDPQRHAQVSLEIARRLAEDPAGDTAGADQIVPAEVLAANFWLLSAPKGHPAAHLAWFPPGAPPLPAVAGLRQQAQRRAPVQAKQSQPVARQENRTAPAQTPAAHQPISQTHPIAHYLLLPSYEWGIADWHMDVIRPFVKKHRPTIGFSLAEASQAARVTVIGGEGCFASVEIDRLRQLGCLVRQITGDGTIIASQLADI